MNDTSWIKRKLKKLERSKKVIEKSIIFWLKELKKKQKRDSKYMRKYKKGYKKGETK